MPVSRNRKRTARSVALILGLAVWFTSIAAGRAQADPIFLSIDGGTCVPRFFFGINDCVNRNFYAHRGGVDIVNTFSNDFTRIDGILDDERFLFTTGSTAFGRASADLSTGELKVEVNSIEGTSILAAAVRPAMGDTLHLVG